MSLIPYPNVPPLPGVPALNRSSSPFVGAGLNILAQTGAVNNIFKKKIWSITDTKTTQVLLQPDSFVDFEYREDRKIPTYPIEDGSFQSYNKVSLPYDIRVTVTCGGNGTMTKGAFLTAINDMLNNLTLVDVATPDAKYVSTNLIHADYRRDSRHGATLLIVQLHFQKVRVVQQPAPPTTQPSGAKPSSNGAVTPVTPAPTVQNQLQGASKYVDFGVIGNTTGQNSWK